VCFGSLLAAHVGPAYARWWGSSLLVQVLPGPLLERFGVNARLLRRPARALARMLFRTTPGLMWTVIADYAIAALRISPANPMANHPLGTRSLGGPGATVLGMKRTDINGLRYVANP